jgi:hypothetical protein
MGHSDRDIQIEIFRPKNAFGPVKGFEGSQLISQLEFLSPCFCGSHPLALTPGGVIRRQWRAVHGAGHQSRYMQSTAAAATTRSELTSPAAVIIISHTLIYHTLYHACAAMQS